MLQRTAVMGGMVDHVLRVSRRPRRPNDAPLMAAIFADHVVLQRDRPIEVWGRAQPGEQVTVTMSGATRSAVSGCRGTLVGGIAVVPGRRTLSTQRAHQQPRAEGGRCAGGRCVAVLGAVEHGMGGAQQPQCAARKCSTRPMTTIRHVTIPRDAAAGPMRRLRSGRSNGKWPVRDHAGFFGGLLLLRARVAEER